MLPVEWVDRARPRPGMLLVRRDEQEDTYGGVIIIPESARRRKPPRAVVVAVGSFVRDKIAVGDRVLLAVGVTKRVTFEDGPVLHLCRPSQVMMVLESAVVDEVSSPAVFSPYFSERDGAAEEGLAEEGS